MVFVMPYIKYGNERPIDVISITFDIVNASVRMYVFVCARFFGWNNKPFVHYAIKRVISVQQESLYCLCGIHFNALWNITVTQTTIKLTAMQQK